MLNTGLAKCLSCIDISLDGLSILARPKVQAKAKHKIASNVLPGLQLFRVILRSPQCVEIGLQSMRPLELLVGIRNGLSSNTARENKAHLPCVLLGLLCGG